MEMEVREVLESWPSFLECHGLAVAHSVAISRDCAIPVQVLNPTSSPVTLHKGEKLGEGLCHWRVLGRTHLVQYHIDSQGANPAKQLPRRQQGGKGANK